MRIGRRKKRAGRPVNLGFGGTYCSYKGIFEWRGEPMSLLSKTKPKDAIALLKADHKKVKELFDEFESAKNESKKHKIAQEALTELKIHSVIEEEIFYPEVRA